MWERLKRGYREFKEDQPGTRFVHTNERWREQSKGSLTTVLVFVVGAILIVGGLFLGFVPGMPGILFALLGSALIATRSLRMAIWLDWSEVKVRKAWQRCRQALVR